MAAARYNSRRNLAAALLGRTQSTLEETGIDAAPDDELEIDWLRRQLADAAGGQ